MLKVISTYKHPFEMEIGQTLSSAPLSSDPRNHCVPMHEYLTVPDVTGWLILVMPLLRHFNNPPFSSINEIVLFLRQAFEARTISPKR